MFVPGLGTPSGVESFDESIDRRFGSGLGPVGSLVAPRLRLSLLLVRRCSLTKGLLDEHEE